MSVISVVLAVAVAVARLFRVGSHVLNDLFRNQRYGIRRVAAVKFLSAILKTIFDPKRD